MKPSREPYGKCACAFTDGFILTFPTDGDAGEQAARVLRFDQNWFSHFGAPAAESNPRALFSPRYADADRLARTKGPQ